MKGEEKLISIEVNEIPLLYSIIREMGISEAVNGSKQVHWNWVGTSIGDLIELWLCYILSIYRFEEVGTLPTFRLDAAPMQGYGQVEEGTRQNR